MEPLRNEIDQIDDELIKLLIRRFELASEIGEMKRTLSLSVLDLKREEEILKKIKSKNLLIKEELEAVYDAIFTESKKAISLRQHVELPFKRIKIIGLGLIGGSIQKGLSIPLVEEDPELIIISAPIDTIIPIARELKSNVELVVMDVGSVKGEITQEFEHLTGKKIDFISTHPFAGKISSGYENSSPSLFVNAPWIITPHAKNKKSNLDKVSQLIQFLGAKPIIMSSEEHDRSAALVSHIPAIIARLYLQFVQEENSDAINIAGPGFKSFTRLAHDNPELRGAIEKRNRPIIQEILKEWIELMLKEIS